MRLPERAAHAFRSFLYRSKPLPVINVRMRLPVPGVAAHGVAAVAILACVGLAATRSAAPLSVSLVIGTGLGIWSAIRPGYPPAVTGVVISALLMTVSRHSPFDSMSLGVAVVGYLSWRLNMVAGLVPWRSRIEARVLLSWGDGVIVGTTCLLGIVACLIQGQGTWVSVLVGALGLIGMAACLLAARHRSDT